LPNLALVTAIYAEETSITLGTFAVVVGVVGAILIAAGPMFHFMPTNLGAYGAFVAVLIVVITVLVGKGE